MNYSCMDYQKGMENIDSEILENVMSESKTHIFDKFTKEQVRSALEKDKRGFADFGALLSPAAEDFLEQMAVCAKRETANYFGNGIRLFAPLYLANFCVNHCTYCGFRCENSIKRNKLNSDEILNELNSIAASGLDEVLLLTGESRDESDLTYIGGAVKSAAEIFSTVGVEIYPLNTDEYAYLHECGADFVSVYQETYDIDIYESAHPAGPKRCFPYRFNSQERAIRGGMRGVSFGALLGLGDFRRDSFSAGMHAYLLQKKYPHAEISISVPRIRPFSNCAENNQSKGIGERNLLQVMLAYRLFMPFAGITISTRERAGFRNNVIGMCATKISAGVSVGVGGYNSAAKGGEQFEISDERSVSEIHNMIINCGMQPVYTDYIRGD